MNFDYYPEFKARKKNSNSFTIIDPWINDYEKGDITYYKEWFCINRVIIVREKHRYTRVSRMFRIFTKSWREV